MPYEEDPLHRLLDEAGSEEPPDSLHGLQPTLRSADSASALHRLLLRAPSSQREGALHDLPNAEGTARSQGHILLFRFSPAVNVIGWLVRTFAIVALINISGVDGP